MDQRDSFLRELRGTPIGSVSDQSSAEEIFQNVVLRPILKLQNDLFLAVFKNYIVKQKVDFDSFSPEKKMTFIDNAIQRDIKFRNALKGMIIAMFTVEEYSQYIKNSSSLNKRMMNMLIDRLKNQIQIGN